MRHYPRVDLTIAIEETLKAGHPWIFADAVGSVDGTAGDIVDVHDTHGQWLGRGVLDPDSPLRVRLWTLNSQVNVDDRLLEKRIRAAFKRRPFPTTETTGFRLLHGEGDRIPGLVCDIYGSLAVLRPDGMAAERWIKKARQVIQQLLPIEHWVIRRSRKYSGALPQAEWWGEKAEETVTFLENGLTYEVDPIAGQKTGFFLDQRANRSRIARVSRGKRLLNLFGYTGGFSVAAARQEAARTTTVDLAKPALKTARRHFEINGLPSSAHGFEAADVFDYLEQFSDGSAPFEVVVCDPPSFAHRRSDLPKATAKYEELFARVLSIMPDHSTVALASCSSHIDRSRFLDIVSAAAQTSESPLILSGCWSADVDHPTAIGFTEGDYLQFAQGTILRDR